MAHRCFHLLDIAALVAGYGMASLLIRAFWPSAGVESLGILIVLGLGYVWLGLAMSGPLVLFRRRTLEGEGVDRPVPRTWAEVAWLFIGFYWIGMTVLVVPVRMRGTRLIDAGLMGIFPILFACLLRMLSPRMKPPADEETDPSWTHSAALGLLITWPLAWTALILLGNTLL